MKNFDIKIEQDGDNIIITTTNVEKKSKEDFIRTVLKRQTELSSIQNEVENEKLDLQELIEIDETEEEVFKHLEVMQRAEKILKKRKLLKNLKEDTENLGKLKYLLDASMPVVEKLKKDFEKQ